MHHTPIHCGADVFVGHADGKVVLAIGIKVPDGKCTAELVGCLCQVGDARYALMPLLIAVNVTCRQPCQ